MSTKLFLIVAGVLWGTGGLAGALLRDIAGLHPLAVAAYRLLIGGAVAGVALARQIRRLRLTKAVVRRLLASGGLLAIFQASYFGGVAMTSVSLATLVTIGSSPVILAVFTAIQARRLPSGRTSLSVVAAIAGLALLAGTPSTRDTGSTVLGILMCLTAASGFAAFTVINRRPVMPPGPMISLGLLTGGLVLLPVALPLGMALPVRPDALLTVAFLGIVPTAVAYGLYLAALRGVSAVAAALAAVLEPLTATVLSLLFFGERIGATGVIGALLLGVALVVDYSADSGSAQGEPPLPTGKPGAGVEDMSEPKKNALVLHLASGGEPLVYALSAAAAKDLASRLPTVMTSGAVDAPELEDGATVIINFAHVATAHFDELPPLSKVYGSAATPARGFTR